MFKKFSIHKKQEKHSKKSEEGNLLKSLTPEERRQIAMEMSWSCGMLPPGTIPDGIWYLY